jgi:hypothetical protein
MKLIAEAVVMSDELKRGSRSEVMQKPATQ